MVERLTKGDGLDRRGHEFRYHLAAGFLTMDTDMVLDAACGTGYGMEWLFRDNDYRGVDRDLSALELGAEDRYCRGKFIEADLDVWVPDFEFDVFVSFETLEHVKDPAHLLYVGAQARQWMILSVPVVPTKHVNEFHLHDFYPGWLEANVKSEAWEHYQTVVQPSEVSEIAVFRRVE